MQTRAKAIGGKMDPLDPKYGRETAAQNKDYNCVMGDDKRTFAEIMKDENAKRDTAAKICHNKEGAVWLEKPTVHVVGNNNTVNVPDKTQQFEQRCWELYRANVEGDEITSWELAFKYAVQGVDVFERKMKELQEKEGEG